jgi:hypothetical protein
VRARLDEIDQRVERIEALVGVLVETLRERS